MTRFPQARPWRSVIAAAAAITVTAGVAVAAPDDDTAQDAPAPKLSLIAASNEVTLDSYKESPGVYLDLGTYITAENGPLELKVTRKSYKDPVVAAQIIRFGTKKHTKTLPARLVRNFAGLPDFAQVTLTDAAGRKVLDKKEAFCPNNASGRIRPDAPAKSKYPESCPVNPFTLGSVWGVENGWASNTYAGYYSDPVRLPAGKYTAKVSVTKRYRELFGMENKPRTIKVTVRERSYEDEGPGAGAAMKHGSHAAGHAGHGATPPPVPAAPTSGAGPSYNVGHGPHTPAPPALPWSLKKAALKAAQVGDGTGRTDGSRKAPAVKAAAKRPTGAPAVPDVPKPDLRSLPAYGIAISKGQGSTRGKDYLAFSANVWNAGPAQLVVDGFRSPGKKLMDAYQYFYDANGKQVGYTPTGTMEWDPRRGHEHWHFTDFASYRLLKADQKEAVRSGKEAFCLANTDAVDYTVKNANWHPGNTDLSTACGQENSISVREVLDVGSGDTYTQDLPGQSFDITNLANGTYYIQVLANPEKRLKETSLTNNSALRKVVLGGSAGARTVTVPAHDLVNAN
ncbi:protein-lysine 6-oxidase [Streptomyces agglomeratus]|uniref:Protein-lysine 6-oxidase n=1 Tax=Streptomyces agglomeratus TaxID=285458 RepID=A0A1E5P2E4_9ACTN|nr:lysyl oxidase family protein [Streptomyces agglomeratus]OEJ23700.1 protein-lysine 6-oxidase [Streptomyces agglomeratus]OEJ43292.1 protein-lysine 6-oxidase [Streptomyces agglomeratus]OEJ54788.1 protein-lysine 6-oxidase [Streptomyces agglomeratus]OEJ62161.1 protein-lysine 6-oxidase [Streptomyces agglomeratus]